MGQSWRGQTYTWANSSTLKRSETHSRKRIATPVETSRGSAPQLSSILAIGWCTRRAGAIQMASALHLPGANLVPEYASLRTPRHVNHACTIENPARRMRRADMDLQSRRPRTLAGELRSEVVDPMRCVLKAAHACHDATGRLSCEATVVAARGETEVRASAGADNARADARNQPPSIKPRVGLPEGAGLGVGGTMPGKWVWKDLSELGSARGNTWG